MRKFEINNLLERGTHYFTKIVCPPFRTRSSYVLRLTSYVLALFVLTASAHATTATWTGTTNGNWDLDANWGGTKPIAGDDLVFPAGGSNKSTTNDYPADTSFNSITFQDSGYTLAGNAITMAGNITDSTGSGTNTISLNMAFAATRTVTVASGGELQISGVVSGAGGVTKEGTGRLILSGNNAYTGVSTIADGAIYASDVTVDAGVSNLGNAASAVVLGSATTAGNLTYTGNTATYTRGFTVNAGGGRIESPAGKTLTIGTNGIAASGTITFAGAGDVDMTATISGGGGVTMAGTGNYWSRNNHTYTGVTTVNSGYLRLDYDVPASGAGPLGNATSDILLGDTSGSANASIVGCNLGIYTHTMARNITVRSGSSGVAYVRTSCGTTWTFSGDITLNKDLSLTTNGHTDIQSMSGIISGNFGLTIAGAGAMVLSGGNTYTGVTTMTQGKLTLGGNAPSASAGVLGNASSAVLLGGTSGSADAMIYTNGPYNIARDITVRSGSSGVKRIGTDSADASTFSGAITLQTDATIYVPTGGETTLSGVISGGFNLTKAGAGKVTISGNNSYTGTTTIADGAIYASDITVDAGVSNLGNAASAVVLGSASTQGRLAYTGSSATFTRGFTVNAGGGQIDNLVNSSLWIDTGGIVTSGLLTIGGSKGTIINSVISGTGGVTKTGDGELSLYGVNTYTGTTTINQGNLYTRDAPSGSAGSLGNATSDVILGDTSGSNAADLRIYGSYTVARNITVRSGSSGNAYITGMSGANPTFSGNITLERNVYLASWNAGTRTSFTGVISGGFNVSVFGSDNAALSLSGTNTYTGTTTVNSGVLLLGTNAPSGSAGALGNAASAVLLGSTGGTFDAAIYTNGPYNIARDITVRSGSSGTKRIGTDSADASTFSGAITLQTDATIYVPAGGETTLSGVISGGFNLTKVGAGKVTISGNNTYTGTTTIADGSIYASDVKVDAGVSNLGNAASAIVLGTATTKGTLTFIGAAGDSITRALTVNAGGGELDNRGAGTFYLSGGVNTSGEFTVDGLQHVYVNNAISGTGGLTKTGTGEFTLAVANTYEGVTTLNTGNVYGGPDRYGNASSDILLGDTTGSTGVRLSTSGNFTRNITVRSGSSGAAVLYSSGTVAGNIALQKDLYLNLYGSGSFTVSGVISGDHNVILSGSGGKVTLSGANTYTGTTSIGSNMALVIGADAPSGAPGALGNATSAVLLGSTGGTTDAMIYISGPYNVGRDITVRSGSSGTKRIGTDAASAATFSGAITLQTDATIYIPPGGSATLSGEISGGFNLTKAGAGGATLSGDNTYTGTTTIADGTIYAADVKVDAGVSNLGNAASAVVLGTATTKGTLSYTGNTDTFDRGLTVNAGGGQLDTTTAGQILQVQTAGITANGPFTSGGAGSNYFYSAISGTGSFTKTGTGSSILISGSNSYTGDTTVLAGNLSFNTNVASGVNGAFGNSTNAVILGDTSGTNGAQILSNANNLTFGRDITVRSGSSGTFIIGTNITTGSTTYTGNIALNRDIQLYARSGSSVVFSTGVISGTGGVTTNGPVYLNGTNTYTGVTTNIAGPLFVGGNVPVSTNSPLGNAASAVLLGNTSGSLDAMIYTTGAYDIARPITVQSGSSGVKRIGTDSAGAATYSGAIALNADTTIYIPTGGSATLSGVISGAGKLTKDAPGSVTISNANNFTGGVTLNAGTINMNNAAAFGTVAGTFTINGGTIDSTNASISPLAYPMVWNADFTYGGTRSLYWTAAPVTMNNNITVTCNGGGGYQFSIPGVIGGAFNLIKTGIGNLSLSGANTYTGTTSILQGTVGVTSVPSGAPGSFGNSTSDVILGDNSGNLATIDVSGNNTFARNVTVQAGAASVYLTASNGNAVYSGNVALNRDLYVGQGTADKTLTFSGVISGGYSVTTSPSGNRGTVILSGLNTYTGTTSVPGGTLTLGRDAPSGSAGALGNAASAVLLGDTSGTRDAMIYTNGAYNIGRPITVRSGSSGTKRIGTDSSAGSTYSGAITLNTDTTIYVPSGGAAIFSGIISGAGNLTKAAPGSVYLNGNNTYTGSTTLLSGYVVLGTNAPSGAPGAFGNATSDILFGDTSGSSFVYLRVSGAYTIGRNINIRAGSSGEAVLYGFSGDAVFSGNIALNRNATFAHSGGGLVTLSGVISGAGNLSIGDSGLANSGTVILTNTNTYSGTTTVSQGTLLLGADAPSGSDGTLGNATSAVLLGHTSGTPSASLLTNGAYTVGRDVTVRSGSSGTKTIGGNTADTSTYSGTFTFQADASIYAYSGGTVAITQPMTSANAVTKTGAGTLRLGDDTDVGGNFTLSNGTLDLDANDPDLTVGGDFAISPGAVFQRGSGILRFDGNTSNINAAGQHLGHVRFE